MIGEKLFEIFFDKIGEYKDNMLLLDGIKVLIDVFENITYYRSEKKC